MDQCDDTRRVEHVTSYADTSGTTAVIQIQCQHDSTGRAVGYEYASDVDDLMSRVSFIFEDDGHGDLEVGETNNASYQYLGIRHIVEEELRDLHAHHARTGRPLGRTKFLDRLERLAGRILKSRNSRSEPKSTQNSNKKRSELGNVSPELPVSIGDESNEM